MRPQQATIEVKVDSKQALRDLRRLRRALYRTYAVTMAQLLVLGGLVGAVAGFLVGRWSA